jgi:hypothetical protein
MVTTSSSKEEVKFRAKKKTATPKKKRQSWDETYADLVKYHKEHDGDCNVKSRDKVYGRLGQWVSKQKRVKDSLQQDQIDRLNAISFNWDKQAASFDKRWDIQFERLCDYKRNLGDCKVPITYEADPTLAQWVVHQRSLYRKGNLRQDREDRLDKLGMIWIIHRKWKEMFKRLKEYKRKHGDLLVLTNRSKVDHHNLGGWVHLQRIMHQRNSILPERKEKLDSVGFPWATRELRVEKQWATMYEQLLEFQLEHNHCMISPKYDEKLSRWVSTQRKEFKEEIMSNERRELLEEVGFTWKIRKGKRDRDTYDMSK